MEDIIKVDKVWLTDTAICIRTSDGREACEKFADFQRLKWATPEQRGNYEVTSYGIYWPELDEDLTVFFLKSKIMCYMIYSLRTRNLMHLLSLDGWECHRVYLPNI